MAKEHNEFRDPIHGFIVLSSDERKVVNSRAFQRLRHIHQLALTWLVYPAATHKRFEHCLGGTYPTTVEGHLRLTDDHVLATMQDDLADPESPRHQIASRILQRRFFRVLYERRAEDLTKNVDAVGAVYRAAREKFGVNFVARDTNISLDKPVKPLKFAVERDDGVVVSSIHLSQILGTMPKAVFDFVFIAPELLDEGRSWLHKNLEKIVSEKESS